MKRVADAKRDFLTLVKIIHRTAEKWLNPHLIYLSKLEQMRIELMDKHVDTRGGAGSSYEFCTKHGMKLRHDV